MLADCELKDFCISRFLLASPGRALFWPTPDGGLLDADFAITVEGQLA
jgi:hypothetical protein